MLVFCGVRLILGLFFLIGSLAGWQKNNNLSEKETPQNTNFKIHLPTLYELNKKHFFNKINK